MGLEPNLTVHSIIEGKEFFQLKLIINKNNLKIEPLCFLHMCPNYQTNN